MDEQKLADGLINSLRSGVKLRNEADREWLPQAGQTQNRKLEPRQNQCSKKDYRESSIESSDSDNCQIMQCESDQEVSTAFFADAELETSLRNLTMATNQTMVLKQSESGERKAH